jgi:DMSO/TMAO reductase YedYZ molybdopterin-dependent catalytic subunit
MAGRRTNLALLWVVVLALLTGVATFTVGTPAGRWVTVAHGLIALALVVLTPWKSTIMGRGLRRARPGRATSVALAVAVVLALTSGLALITGRVARLGPLTTMQIHVAAGLLAMTLTLLHTRRRPIRTRDIDLGRRDLLRIGGLTVAAGAIWLATEGTLDLVRAPGGRRRFTGSHEITDPGAVPATQWLNDSVPHLDPSRHSLDVDGVTLRPEDLAGNDVVLATLDCTGGWYTTQEFAGTRLDGLITSPGRSIVVSSVTGFWRRFPIEQAAQLLLATHMAGEPLRDGNGGPVRLVAPGRRGYWWVKWVDQVVVDDLPPWWQPPLPLA